MRHMLCLAALASLTGCIRTPASWEGIWFIETPATNTVECESDIDENFLDADVPEGDEPVDTPWTYEQSFEGSNGGFFMQVLFEDGVAFGIVDDEVYVGREVKGKELVLTWDSFEDSDAVAKHEEGYRFRQVVSGTNTETITLTKSEKNVYTGTIDSASDTTIEYSETDEWDAYELGLFYGSIPGSSYLEGDGTDNAFDTDDCTGDECDITVSDSCSGSMDVTATYVGKHNEGLFEGIDGAGREPGLGGGGGGTYTY